jgi:hypothetical protein
MDRPTSSELWPGLSDALIDKLLGQYRVDGQAVAVDVRRDVEWVNLGERLTHSLHPYPARLIRHIPVLMLHCTRYSMPGDLVVDPFCGSGTVLLEALVAGRRAVGADANPLARLISAVKVRPIPEPDLLRAISATFDRLPSRAPSPPPVVNRNYWFTEAASRQLSKLGAAIRGEPDPHLREFLEVCMSVTVRRASLADPRISVPVKLRRNQYPPDHWLHHKTNARLDAAHRHDVVADFRTVARENARRVGSLAEHSIGSPSPVVTSDDARAIRTASSRRLRRDSAQLVLTSPPYLGAQKYIRASSLSLGWLGETELRSLRDLEELAIGREHFRKDTIRPTETGLLEADRLIAAIRDANPLRAQIASAYLVEMRYAVREIYRILRPGGTFVMVTGSNSLCGQPFHTTRYLTAIAAELGFELELELLDSIRSRGLMTRRNASAAVIEAEAITVLRKPAAEGIRA